MLEPLRGDRSYSNKLISQTYWFWRKPGVARKGGGWCPLVDIFRNNEIAFDISLQSIQALYSSFGLAFFEA